MPSVFKRPVLISFGVGITLTGMSAYIWRLEHRPEVLEIYAFQLKGVQALFIRTPDDRKILVNGGSNAEIVRHISSVLPFYSRHIDAIVATDADGKNVSGLIDTIARYEVSHAYIPALTSQSIGIASSSDTIYQVFIDEISHKNIPVTRIQSGDYIDIDISMRVLFPVAVNEFEYSRASAPALVVKISYKGNAVYVIGDVTTRIQKHIAAQLASSSDPVRKKENVLIVSGAAGAGDISKELVDVIRPTRLIYSKSDSVVRSGSGKKVIDPLVTVLPKNRFNLKEKGTVKIVMGAKLEIE